ncbi:MAG: zinc ABC transporter substrate-binding protein [Treponema sp.]|nr:zinc ABC transporter substrate-binding protein [Treponema sp.]
MLILLLFFSGCVRQPLQDGLLIAVSIPPQAWFVSQIAGDNADVLILVPPGQNPHNYEPTPRQIQRLASASAWILSGTEFEITLLPKIKRLFPDLLIIDGTLGVEFRYLEEECEDHFHDLQDRHTWLGREPVKILSGHIRDTLCLFDAEMESYYRRKYENLVNKIDNEFFRLRDILEPLRGKSVFVYHPSFGYFLDEFEIIQEAVETGGKEPTPRQLNFLIGKMIKENAAALFVQTQYPVNAARTIANAAGAQVIELDPLAQDWLNNIRHMGEMLQKAAL